jgi:hypothetical protein
MKNVRTVVLAAVLVTLTVHVLAQSQPSSGSTPLTTSKPAEEPKIVIARLNIAQKAAQDAAQKADKNLANIRAGNIVAGQSQSSDYGNGKVVITFPSQDAKTIRIKEAQDAAIAAKAKLIEANAALADYKKSLIKPTSMPATRPTSQPLDKLGASPTSRPAITDTQPAAGYETY